jgi:hypothetical protein
MLKHGSYWKQKELVLQTVVPMEVPLLINDRIDGGLASDAAGYSISCLFGLMTNLNRYGIYL